MMNPCRVVVGAIASVALLGACGTDVRDIEPERGPDVSLIIAGDYDVAESPEELIDKRQEMAHAGLDIEAIAVGAVEEIVQGRDIWMVPDDPEPDRYLVMRVRVSDVLLGDGQIVDERVYVELHQGGVDADGSMHHSLEEWNTAIPRGTRVMLFLLDAYQPGPYEVDHAGRGVPDGATLMQPDPQGLIFEYDDKVFTQDDGAGDSVGELWGVSSIEEIIERVRQHLA